MQYFQFDNDGNMFVYEPGAGCSGLCVKVDAGFDENQSKNVFSAGSQEVKVEPPSHVVTSVKCETACVDESCDNIEDQVAVTPRYNKFFTY